MKNTRLTNSLITALICIFLVAIPALCSAAWVTMTANGEKQGIIKGDNTAPGQQGTIVVLAIACNMQLSNGGTGTLQPGPVSITKNLDQATPKLMQAFATKEILTSVVIRFYEMYLGSLRNNFTITLTNAEIGELGDGGNAQVQGGVQETINLYWRTMTLRDEITGVSTKINWPMPT